MTTPPDVAALLEPVTGQALAYIGPGAGLGAILMVVALGLGALLLVLGLVWYPLKRVLRNRRGDEATGTRDDAAGAGQDGVPASRTSVAPTDEGE